MAYNTHPPSQITKSQKTELEQIPEYRKGSRLSREVQNLESYNTIGTQEPGTTEIGRRKRPVPLQTLMEDFAFYERKADIAGDSLPQSRELGEETEAKQRFAEFKHATEGMAATGQSIIDKLVTDGMTAESRKFNEK